jgi:HK97 family phage prohead protease
MRKKTTQRGRIKLLQQPGQFEAVFATLGVIDADGDVIQRGAFQPGQKVRISSWGHKRQDLPVGKGAIYERDNEAICEGAFFLDTAGGRETYATVKNLGDLQEWSFGYDIEKSRLGEFQGQNVQFLERLIVFEVSPVMIGAGIGTRTVAMKGAGGARLTPSQILARIRALEKASTSTPAMALGEVLGLAADDPGTVRAVIADMAPTNADAIRDQLRAAYPAESDRYIEAMLAGELAGLAEDRFREAELHAWPLNLAWEYGQVLAWAGQPAR